MSNVRSCPLLLLLIASDLDPIAAKEKNLTHDKRLKHDNTLVQCFNRKSNLFKMDIDSGQDIQHTLRT